MPSPFGYPMAGDSKKFIVRAASTANIANMAACSTTMDGVTLVEGNLVLLKNQTASQNNGIFKVGAVAAGLAPLTRDGAADLYIGVGGCEVYVTEGTLSANHTFTLTTDAPIVVGTTSLTFAEPTLAAAVSLETRLSGAESVGELSSAAVYTSFTSRLSTAESVETSAMTSVDARVSTESSTRASADASLTTSVSSEESTRASADTSLETRFSTGLSVDVSTTDSLTTRVSIEESTRTSQATSLTNKDSVNLSTAQSGIASLVVVDSTSASTLTSSVVSLTTRLSIEESTRLSQVQSLAAG